MINIFKKILNWFLPKRTILFVCSGNTCRSPMAATLANHMLAGTRYRAESAGTSARDGEPASKNAVAVMQERGLDLSRHNSRRINPRTLRSAYFVYAMTATHASVIRRECPEVSAFNLGEISDPYGGDMITYRECANEIEERLKGALKHEML